MSRAFSPDLVSDRITSGDGEVSGNSNSSFGIRLSIEVSKRDNVEVLESISGEGLSFVSDVRSE
jgi:hypothetical protein